MIWNYIRDFLVQYIFGGFTSEGDAYYGFIGNMSFSDSGEISEDLFYTTNHFLPMFYDQEIDGTLYMSLGDWLSTTFTIIIMCLIVVFCIWLVRWIFKTVSSAMLLK